MSPRSRLLFLLWVALVGLVQAQGPIRQSEDWLVKTKEHRMLDALERELGTPNIPLSRGMVVEATLTGAMGEILVVGPTSGDAKAYASVLRDWEAKQGETADVQWSQENDCAAARLAWSHAKMGARSRHQAVPVGDLAARFRERFKDVNVVIRIRKHVAYSGAVRETARTQNYRYFDLAKAAGSEIFDLTSSLSPLTPLVFVLFVAFVPLSSVLGLTAGWWIAARSNLPITRRRRLYSKVVFGSCLGSIGLHAPLVFVLLATGWFQPVSDVWFGTTSLAASFMPFLMLPVLLLMFVVPVFGRLEKRLFGATPEETSTLPPPEALAPEQKAHLRKVAILSVAVALIGAAIWILPDFLMSPKSDARFLLGLAGMLLLFLGPTAIRWAMRKGEATVSATAEDPELEREARGLAERMGSPFRSLRVDRSPLGLQTAGASASGKGDIRVTARAQQILSADERRFILAHELAHLRLKHVQQRRLRVVVPYLLMCLPMIYLPFAMAGAPRLPVGFGFAGVIMAGAYLTIYGRRLMKQQEFEADRLALHFTGDVDAAEAALRKMAMGTPMPHMHDLDEQTTHPALSRRIRNLRLGTAAP